MRSIRTGNLATGIIESVTDYRPMADARHAVKVAEAIAASDYESVLTSITAIITENAAPRLRGLRDAWGPKYAIATAPHLALGESRMTLTQATLVPHDGTRWLPFAIWGTITAFA